MSLKCQLRTMNNFQAVKRISITDNLMNSGRVSRAFIYNNKTHPLKPIQETMFYFTIAKAHNVVTLKKLVAI